MSALVFFLAAVNPVRAAAALPGRGRAVAATVAALVVLAVAITLAAASDLVLDALAVSASTFRIGAGSVMAVGGVVRMVDRLPRPEPEVDGWRAGLVPLAFPVVLSPDLALLAISVGADEGVATVAVAAAVAAAALVGGAFVPRPLASRGRTTAIGVARLLAAVLLVAGVALAVDGVQDL